VTDYIADTSPTPQTPWRRLIAYLLLGAGLTAAYAAAGGLSWQGSAALHTTMEVVATLLASIVGVIALLRYYARRETGILFVGAGFLGTAFLDGYHALVTSAFIRPMMPSELPALIPWSWIASRQFLAVFLALSCFVWLWERKRQNSFNIDPRLVYLFTAAVAAASFLFFAFAPLPRAYYPELFFHRPEEFGPAIFFLLALIGYFYKGAWREDPIDHWLVMALIASVAGQAVTMPLSGTLFDLEFDAAHALKIMSYLCALTGFLDSIYRTLKSSNSLNAKLTREIRERKREQDTLLALQNELRDSEEKSRTTLETIADGVVTIDAEGIVKSFNPAAEKLFGHAASDVRGQNLKMLMPDAIASQHDNFLETYLATGKSGIIGVGRELVAERKDGSKFDIELAVSEMRIGDERMFTGVIRDISQRKRDMAELKKYAEDLRQSNFELEQFASVASHDLQEPLRKVQAFGDRLRLKYADKLGDEGQDYIERMQKSTVRMQVLINSLLTFSRISTNEQPYKPVNLNNIVKDVSDDLEIGIRENDVRLEVQHLPVIEADALQMRQLFQNLIGNAVKYRRPDTDSVIVISAHITGSHANPFGKKCSRICHIRVSDNGIGFDDAYAHKIFGIFQRLHGRSEYEGTGVGLAICRKIVERHGGVIEASGTENHGAVFIASLPVSHAQQEVF